MRSSKIIINKTEAICETYRIQVFCPNICSKPFYTEMDKRSNIGEVLNGYRILWHKLPHHR